MGGFVSLAPPLPDDRSATNVYSWAASWFLLLAPLAFAIVLELFYSDTHSVLFTDEATLELRVLEAKGFEQVLGPYSRHGWSHPGPLYFYLLAPLYALTENSAVSLFVTAGLINLAAFAAVARLLPSDDASLFRRTAILAGLAGLLMVVEPAHLPNATTAIWNPIIAILPFICLVAVSARLSAGDVRWLPLVLFAHAFVSQTHIAFVVPAAICVMFSGVCLVLARSHSPCPRVWIITTLGLAFFAWAPVAYDEFFGSHNLSTLIEYLVDNSAESIGYAEGYKLASERLTEPIDRLLGGAISDSAHAQLTRSACCAAQLLLMVLALWRARSLQQDHRWLIVALALAQWVMLVPVLSRIDNSAHDYLSAWVPALAVLSMVSTVNLLTKDICPRPARYAVAVPLFALVVSSGVQVDAQRTRMQRAHKRGKSRAKALLKLAVATELVLDEHPEARLVIKTHSRWGHFAGVLALLRKRGRDPLVDEKWRFMFGDGFRYAERSAVTLEFWGARRPEADNVAHAARVWLDLRYKDDRVARGWALPLEFVGADDITGTRAAVVDGYVPKSGAPATPATALRLEGVGSQLIVAVPESVTALSLIELTAIGGLSYDIEVSKDGDKFHKVGHLKPTKGGMRRRRIWLRSERGKFKKRAKGVRFLRATVSGGGGDAWISEFAARGSEPMITAVEPGEHRVDAGALIDGVRARVGSDAGGPRVIRLGPSKSIIFALADLPFRGLRVWSSEPAGHIYVSSDNSSWHELTLECSPDKGSPDAQRSCTTVFPAQGARRVRLSGPAIGNWRISEVSPLFGVHAED